MNPCYSESHHLCAFCDKTYNNSRARMRLLLFNHRIRQCFEFLTLVRQTSLLSAAAQSYCLVTLFRAMQFKAASSNGSAHHESVSFMSRCVVCD